MTDTQARLDAFMHRGVRGLRRVHTPDSRDAMARLQQALAQGANPNHRHTDGRTPLDFLGTDPRAQGRGKHGIDQFCGAVCLIIRHGGDPMLPQCRLLTHANPYIASAAAGSLITYEQATRKAWHDNQNPLHVLALEPKGRSRLGHFRQLGAVLPPHWASQARHSDGATPLHLAWKAGALEQGEDEGRKEFTRRLLQMGAQLDCPDSHGVRVWELIVQKVEQGGEPADEECMNQVRALAEQARLEQRTVPVIGWRASKGHRL